MSEPLDAESTLSLLLSCESVFVNSYGFNMLGSNLRLVFSERFVISTSTGAQISLHPRAAVTMPIETAIALRRELSEMLDKVEVAIRPQ